MSRSKKPKKLETPELLDDLAAKAGSLAKQLFGCSDALAMAFGSELAQQTATDLGGQPFYWPKGIAYKVSRLHLDVWDAFTGYNHRELAKRFDISLVWVYAIIRRMRAADVAARQGQIFPPPDSSN